MNIFDKFLITIIIIFIILFFATTGRHNPSLGPKNILKAKKDIKVIQKALVRFHDANRSYPTTDEGLESLSINPDISKYPNHKKQIKMNLIDPWGNPYKYESPGNHLKIDIYSFGADGILSDDDVGNWQFN